MPRNPRIVLAGYPHHVTQRGNNHGNVFFTDDDRRTYLAILGELSERHAVDVIGYCLMSNHIHLLVVPPAADTLAKAIGGAHFRYARHVNRASDRSGHLWHGRFYSCPLSGAHFWRALAYVESNPVRAGIVGEAWAYPWSSARWRVGLEDRNDLLEASRWPKPVRGADWASVLRGRENQAENDRIRMHTLNGRPLMPDREIDRLEREQGRRLRAHRIRAEWRRQTAPEGKGSRARGR